VRTRMSERFGCGRGWSRTLLRRPHRASYLIRRVLSPRRRLRRRGGGAGGAPRSRPFCKGPVPAPGTSHPAEEPLPNSPVPGNRNTHPPADDSGQNLAGDLLNSNADHPGGDGHFPVKSYKFCFLPDRQLNIHGIIRGKGMQL